MVIPAPMTVQLPQGRLHQFKKKKKKIAAPLISCFLSCSTRSHPVRSFTVWNQNTRFNTVCTSIIMMFRDWFISHSKTFIPVQTNTAKALCTLVKWTQYLERKKKVREIDFLDNISSCIAKGRFYFCGQCLTWQWQITRSATKNTCCRRLSLTPYLVTSVWFSC